ncbi:acyl carrier protein [Streptomyces sp. NBC_01725]|uniref:acyl carrier protein n=1 Tax=unclassified Streptomyces TaxID=2593676 RepID=UPI0011C72FBB|nr:MULTISPECIES: acyl carrier protein [unclassified Streptomyces]TXL84357.1 acyl carrier protein [Streptomyces sp. IB2014 016-6]
MAELTEPTESTESTELTGLVADVLQMAPAEVTEDTGPATTAAWTSLRHVQIVARVEQTYGVRLTAREVRGCRSVGALRGVLAEKRETT